METLERTPKQAYGAIDACKLLMSIFVVAIHIQPLPASARPWMLSLYGTLNGCAVPFFFLASGFFLGRKMRFEYADAEDRRLVLRFFRRMAKLYVLWTLVYLPLSVCFCIRTQRPAGDFLWQYLRDFLFYGKQYGAWFLWYLLAAAYAALFVWLLLRLKVKLPVIAGIGFGILVASYLLDVFLASEKTSAAAQLFSYLVGGTIRTGRVFRGMFFLPMGMVLAKRPMPRAAAWAMLLVGLGVRFFRDDTIGYILLSVGACGLFSLVLSLRWRERRCFVRMRYMSTAVFFLHMYVWALVRALCPEIGMYGAKAFLCVTGLTLLIAWGYARWRERYAVWRERGLVVRQIL